jgi:hypothetical protein
MKQSKLLALRAIIEKASASLNDTDALSAPELFPAWAAGVDYALDVRVRYGDKLYKCVQAHTSQANWTPDATPALWTEVAPPGEIPVWKQPTGAQDAYMAGDKAHYPTKKDPVYVNTVDYNVYAPDVYGWVKLNQ